MRAGGGGVISNSIGQVHYCWVIHINHSETILWKLYRDDKDTAYYSILKINLRNWQRFSKIGSKSLEINIFSNRCHSLVGWVKKWKNYILKCADVDYYGTIYIKQGSIEKNRIFKILAGCFYVLKF